MNFKNKLNNFLNNCENPQVYTGKEINVVKKDFSTSKLNICLIFPDKYEIGMSHYGIKLLYHLLNKIDNVNIERCFLPDKDSGALLKKLDLPLFSIENKIPLKEFDLIGFSLLSEMNYTNILAILDLSQIPLYSSERDDNSPIITAGGISVINPEPIRSFIDLFAIGDGESLFPDIISKLIEGKEQNLSKDLILKILNKIKGIYIPSFYELIKEGDFIRPDIPAQSIKKNFIKDINSIRVEDKIIVPITNVIFDRLDIEIARGCPQNCRFCQAKSYYSPYRYRATKTNLHTIKQGLKNTGFESAALSTLSAGDYPYIEELLKEIPNSLPQTTAISFSSLRPASISDQLLKTISQFRKTGLTIVPEAGSERLRNVINKNVTDKEIFDAVEKALNYGWQKIKLYFMIGLPTEVDEDIDAIIVLIKKIIDKIKEKKKRLKITISFSSFVPKPHTPFQWAKREDSALLKSKIKKIRGALERFRFLALDFHKIERGIVETILARGDRDVEKLLLNVYKRGEIFSAWDSEFNYEIWNEEMQKLDYEKYLAELDTNKGLPWDFFEINFKENFLKQDYLNALKEKPAVSCIDADCKTCDGCNYRFKKSLKKPDTTLKIEPVKKDTVEVEYNKIRVFFEKIDDFKYFSHLSMSKYIERIIRRTGIRYKSTEGFRPRLKIAYLPPLPVYANGENEVFELFVDNKLSESDLYSKFNSFSGDLKINKIWICNERKSLNKDIAYISYQLNTEINIEQRESIANILREPDEITYSENTIDLKVDFTDRGPEQFAKIYKSIDPEKKHTNTIVRKEIIFR